MHNSVNQGTKVKKGTLLIVCGYQGIANCIKDRPATLALLMEGRIFTDYFLLKFEKDVSHVGCPPDRGALLEIPQQSIPLAPKTKAKKQLSRMLCRASQPLRLPPTAGEARGGREAPEWLLSSQQQTLSFLHSSQTWTGLLTAVYSSSLPSEPTPMQTTARSTAKARVRTYRPSAECHWTHPGCWRRWPAAEAAKRQGAVRPKRRQDRAAPKPHGGPCSSLTASYSRTEGSQSQGCKSILMSDLY